MFDCIPSKRRRRTRPFCSGLGSSCTPCLRSHNVGLIQNVSCANITIGNFHAFVGRRGGARDRTARTSCSTCTGRMVSGCVVSINLSNLSVSVRTRPGSTSIGVSSGIVHTLSGRVNPGSTGPSAAVFLCSAGKSCLGPFGGITRYFSCITCRRCNSSSSHATETTTSCRPCVNGRFIPNLAFPRRKSVGGH